MMRPRFPLLVAGGILLSAIGYLAILLMLSRARDTLENLEAEVEGLRTTKSVLEESKRGLEEQIGGLRDEETRLLDKLEKTETKIEAANSELDSVYDQLSSLKPFLENQRVSPEVIEAILARLPTRNSATHVQQRGLSLSRDQVEQLLKFLPRDLSGPTCAKVLSQSLPGDVWATLLLAGSVIAAETKTPDESKIKMQLVSETEETLKAALKTLDTREGNLAKLQKVKILGHLGQLTLYRAQNSVDDKERFANLAVGWFEDALSLSAINSQYWTDWYEGAIDALGLIDAEASGRTRRVDFACSPKWYGRSVQRVYRFCVQIQRQYGEAANVRGDKSEARTMFCGAARSIALIPDGKIEGIDLPEKRAYYQSWCDRLSR